MYLKTIRTTSVLSIPLEKSRKHLGFSYHSGAQEAFELGVRDALICEWLAYQEGRWCQSRGDRDTLIFLNLFLQSGIVGLLQLDLTSPTALQLVQDQVQAAFNNSYGSRPGVLLFNASVLYFLRRNQNEALAYLIATCEWLRDNVKVWAKIWGLNYAGSPGLNACIEFKAHPATLEMLKKKT